MKAAFFNNGGESGIGFVFPSGRIEKIKKATDLYPEVITKDNFVEKSNELKDLEIIFSTWGMLSLSEEEISSMPSLKAIFYAAGSVQGFAKPFLNKEIKVFSAWQANAIPVAEFTLAHILLSTKGYLRNVKEYSDYSIGKNAFRGKGNYGATVALLGLGSVARSLVELLKPFKLNLIAYDPYVSDEDGAKLGAKMVSLEEAFEQGYVVSNHMPNLPATQNIMTKIHFESMTEGATFINTGRGAQLIEEDLITVFQKRNDLCAILDVTNPEPPVESSPLYTMENIHLSSHVAGSLNDEKTRMADYMIEEFHRFEKGETLQFEVSSKLLETMA